MMFAMAEKKAILNLRLDPKVRDDFALVAKLRGASMSGLIHQFIVMTIRQEKAESPHEFRNVARLAPVAAHISPSEEVLMRKEIAAQLSVPILKKKAR